MAKHLILFTLFSWSAFSGSIQEDYTCVENELVSVTTNKTHISYDNESMCERAIAAANFNVICRYFTYNDPNIGVGSRPSTGWRPSNINTLMGLGRYTFPSFAKCLKATMAASEKYVCTNTGGDHYKSTHVDSNVWCGSSVYDKYCFDINPQLGKKYICSYPSDGLGAQTNGWMVTKVDSKCNYQGSKMSAAACLAKIKTMEGEE